MWEGMASGHTPNYKRNKLTKSPQQPSDNRFFSDSLSPETSQHLLEAGLTASVAASSSSPPTRRLSSGSSAAAGKGTATAAGAASHRISVRRLNARSRLGRTPPLVLSKAVQSLQMVRDDLAKLASSSCPIKPVNTISTQTLEQDELSGSATSMITKRHSRIPVRQDRIKRDRDRDRGAGQKEDPSGAVKLAEELYTSYSKCNVFSVVNISVSASKLQTIDSTSKLSVAVKPSVEKREFCTVSQASILACPEFKFRTVDVDTTLENWKPNRAELSIVTEPKTTKQKKKVNSKTRKSKSKDKGCWKKGKCRETVCGESTLSASNSDKTSAVDSSDKEKSSGKSSNRKRESDAKTSSRSKTDSKPSANNNDAGCCKSEGITCSGTTSGSNCRVHFSPQLTSSCSPTKAVDEGARTESFVSDKESAANVSKLPDIIKRVTDQAITSIAKSVMLGLPRQLPISDTHQATTLTTSNRHSSTLLPNSGSFQLSRQPPLTMSSLSITDDSYAVHRRNPSQLSVSSLLSSHTQYSPKASNRYKSYRSSAPPLSKTRKDFDNRHSQAWKLPVDAWYHDSGIDSEYLDDTRLSFTRSHNWTRPHSRKRTHKATMPDLTASSWAMPSSSSLYLTEPMRYSRPSQRFSVRGSSGGGLLSSTRSSRISRLDEHDLTRSSRSPMSSYHHHAGFYGSSTPRRLHLRT